MKETYKKLIPVLLAAAALAAALFTALFLIYFNGRHLTVELEGKHKMILEAGEAYHEPGFSAHIGKTVIKDVTIEGSVDEKAVGEYILTYTAVYKGKTACAKRTVRIKDTTAPIISVNSQIEIPIGLAPDKASVEYTASDSFEGDITDRVTLTYNDDAVILTVCDNSGNRCEKKVKFIRVPDTVAPKIKLSGGITFVRLGDSFKDSGCSASDNIDGDITANVKISGVSNLDSAGDYTAVYTVKDSSGNIASAERKVIVFDPEKVAAAPTQENRNIYLTFDDGPCIYTPQILDVLSYYGVKATFFVTNQKPEYQDLIAREAREGHSIAIHTYSHNYAVYSDTETYFNDLNAMNEVIKAQTGSYTRLVRFPGGSSNMISKRYRTGIMKQLAGMLTEKGYIYFDWNISSGDAAGTAASRNPQTVANNVIRSLGDDSYVVLMHDINKANISSLPIIIEYGLSNGYCFLPLNENSPTVHHTINN